MNGQITLILRNIFSCGIQPEGTSFEGHPIASNSDNPTEAQVCHLSTLAPGSSRTFL